jgi:acyl-coenzyme A thioesterase PaaI-like protein
MSSWARHHDVTSTPSSRPDAVSTGRARLLSALRQVQDLVAERNPSDEDLRASSDLLDAVARHLQRSEPLVDEAGTNSWDLRSRELNPLVPPFAVDRIADDIIVGRVIFSPFYHGGGGAAHGGAIPLLFDQVIGRLTNAGSRTRSRTAYLNTNYRRITPIGRQLQLEATLDRQEGRKTFASVRLRDGDDLLADAEGLYITLRPGQP